MCSASEKRNLFICTTLSNSIYTLRLYHVHAIFINGKSNAKCEQHRMHHSLRTACPWAWVWLQLFWLCDYFCVVNNIFFFRGGYNCRALSLKTAIICMIFARFFNIYIFYLFFPLPRWLNIEHIRLLIRVYLMRSHEKSRLPFFSLLVGHPVFIRWPCFHFK